jgi:hypothetical protein
VSDWSADLGSSSGLTLAQLESAMREMEEQGVRVREEEARRWRAWAALDLDTGAMTDEERMWVAYAQTMIAIHPRDAERVERIVNKYRRNRACEDG